MKILIACEESQAVCIEMRRLGHEAYSCDIQPCSGGHPEWHIMGDVTRLLNPGYTKWSIDNYRGVENAYGIEQFMTCDGKRHQVTRWNLIVAHPPCTDLASSGARWFPEKRADGRQQKSIEFFMRFVNADCPCIAIENPIGIMSSIYRKPDQIIQPYQFGHNARKATCLWLEGLPRLKPTDIVDQGEIVRGGFSVGASLNYARDENGKIIPWNDPRTAKIRSKTFPGIARAMAEQWAGPIADKMKSDGGKMDEPHGLSHASA